MQERVIFFLGEGNFNIMGFSVKKVWISIPASFINQLGHLFQMIVDP